MPIPAEHRTRERILEVAEAALAEHGYYGVKMHYIAASVGIQKASLFHYFSSKADLCRAVLNSRFDEIGQWIRLAADVAGLPAERLRLMLGAFVDLVAEHPERTKVLLRQSLGDTPEAPCRIADAERLVGLLTTLVTRCQDRDLRTRLDPVALVLGTIGMVMFLFTVGHAISPVPLTRDDLPGSADLIKGHVAEIVRRTLQI